LNFYACDGNLLDVKLLNGAKFFSISILSVSPWFFGPWQPFSGVVVASELPFTRFQIFAFELNWLLFVFIAYCLLAKLNVFSCVSFLGFRCRCSCRRHCTPAKNIFANGGVLTTRQWAMGSGQWPGGLEECR